MIAVLLLQMTVVPCLAGDATDEYFRQSWGRDRLTVGSLLRVTSTSVGDRKIVGTLMELRGNTLELQSEDGGRSSLPVESCTKVEVQSTRKATGLMAGLLLGGASLFILDLKKDVTYQEVNMGDMLKDFVTFGESGYSQPVTVTKSEYSGSAICRSLLITAATTTFGAIVGSQITHWRQIPITGQMGLTPNSQGDALLFAKINF